MLFVKTHISNSFGRTCEPAIYLFSLRTTENNLQITMDRMRKLLQKKKVE